MDKREDLEKEIEDLTAVRDYFMDLVTKEGTNMELPEIVLHTLYSIVLHTETMIGMKQNEYNLTVEDILGEPNEWEGI